MFFNFRKEPKISVITPCLNADRFIGDAIESVLKQEDSRFEHIIVDGGSTDGTLDVLKQYQHLRWTSRKDSGQSEAMNKGFKMSKGEIIVYLNADDYFLPDAFSVVRQEFHNGAEFVMGKVEVLSPDGNSWINNGSTEHDRMLRHWEPQAFCVNPVGYFYRRSVQKSIGGFNPDNHYAMDLEFLLEVSLKFKIIKINQVLGTFRYFPGTKTKNREQSGNVFTRENFWFLDSFLKDKSSAYVKEFKRDQKLGYYNRNKA